MAWEKMAGGRSFVSVVGTVNLTKSQGKIRYVNPLPQGDLSPTDPDSRVVLRVKRADEQVLHEYQVSVKPFSDQLPGEDQWALLDAVIVVYPDARVVELVVDGETVDTFRAGDTPPGTRGRGTWQTLAVGLVTPEITIDRNQFRAAESVVVRVTPPPLEL